jgi:hypothetical protein
MQAANIRAWIVVLKNLENRSSHSHLDANLVTATTQYLDHLDQRRLYCTHDLDAFKGLAEIKARHCSQDKVGPHHDSS